MIKNIFVEKDLKKLLNTLEIDYKKALKNRIILSLVITLFMIIIGSYISNLYLIFTSFLVGFIFYKYQYFSVKRKYKNFIMLKKRMFPAFVKKLLILLRTNNVYTSFVKMIDYSDEPIKRYLVELIEEIKVDKSVRPFTNFASKMNFIEAYQIMSVLYTFNEHIMSKNHLVSLEKMISELYDNETDELIEKKKRLLWLYPNVPILCMLGLVFSLVIYMFIFVMNEAGL